MPTFLASRYLKNYFKFIKNVKRKRDRMILNMNDTLNSSCMKNKKLDTK